MTFTRLSFSASRSICDVASSGLVILPEAKNRAMAAHETTTAVVPFNQLDQTRRCSEFVGGCQIARAWSGPDRFRCSKFVIIASATGYALPQVSGIKLPRNCFANLTATP
jgi:hypothetical protein